MDESGDNFVLCAEKILKEILDVKNEETVGIVRDVDSKIFRAFDQACKNLELHHTVIEITPDRNQSSPIPDAIPLLEKCNAIVAPTSKSISHSPETTALRKQGKRFITLPGITDGVFLKILNTDINEIEEIEKKLHEQVKNAREVNITTPSGTDIVLNLDPQRGWKGSVPKLKPGELTNLPTGEIFTAPLENGANGTLVIDRWKTITPDEKATIEVENGKIVSWNKEAEIYVNHLKKGGENGLIIAELGIGTNKSHKEPIGNILHDEKIYGTCHIAFGLNTSFGGKNVANVHEDVILLDPVILADGKEVVY